ncbi:Aspartate/glutamate/uridylate kinase [Hypoxylon crocopeplum]|nr:Aspartate/glutamate/uridylate kinase [Hypoxylon crocopeplum]
MANPEQNAFVVHKFGGTSIGKFPDQAADIIASAVLNGCMAAVVCSARSPGKKVHGTTSQLLEVHLILKRMVTIAHGERMKNILRDELQAIVYGIRDEHVSAIKTFVQSPDMQDEACRKIGEDCQQLLDYTDAAVRFNLDIDAHSKDRITSLGEKLSCRFMAAMLRDRNVDADYVHLSDIMFCGSSDCLPQKYFRRAAETFGKRILACNSKVPVITGFFGSVPGSLMDGGIGRGYADLCAALVAVGLQARKLQIWKEVDGIFTADPIEVPNAKLLASITPEEAAELTFYGSEVIHPLALGLTTQAKPHIETVIKNVQKPWSPGTVIVPDTIQHTARHMMSPEPLSTTSLSETMMRKPTALTIKRSITVLNINSNRKFMSYDFFAKIFKILEGCGIVVDIISTSEVNISMAISTVNINKMRANTVRAELGDVAEVNMLPDMAILSLVGRQLKNMTGIAGRMFSVLGDHHVNVEMISQGASEINISCVIPEKDATRAINVLHMELLDAS